MLKHCSDTLMLLYPSHLVEHSLPSTTQLQQSIVFTPVGHSLYRGVSGRPSPSPGRHPPGQNPPGATAVDGTHPTGMLSCCLIYFHCSSGSVVGNVELTITEGDSLEADSSSVRTILAGIGRSGFRRLEVSGNAVNVILTGKSVLNNKVCLVKPPKNSCKMVVRDRQCCVREFTYKR